MANSRDDIEQKLSNETLSYNFPEPRVTDLNTIPNGREIGEQLSVACTKGDVETVKRILETNNIGVNVIILCSGTGWDSRFERYTPVMLAVRHNQMGLLNFLLKQPGIDLSRAATGGIGILGLALNANWHFSNANYVIARQLIEAGANINEVVFSGPFKTTLLLMAWTQGCHNIANELVKLGANIDMSEQLFFSNMCSANFQGAARGSLRFTEGHSIIPQQIALSKEYWEYLNNIKRLGIDLECLSSSLFEGSALNIAEFLFVTDPKPLCENDSLSMSAFNFGRKVMHDSLLKLAASASATQVQSSEPCTFLRNLHSDMYNQKYVPKDKGQDQFSHDKKNGYAPGPGMMDTP